MEQEFEVFFPALSDSADAKEHFSRLKQHTILTLQKIAGREVDEQLRVIEEYFTSRIRPQRFDGKDGAEVKFLKAFEQTCVMMQQHVPKDPRTMTTFEYFSTLEAIRAQLKKSAGRIPGKAKRVNGKSN